VIELLREFDETLRQTMGDDERFIWATSLAYYKGAYMLTVTLIDGRETYVGDVMAADEIEGRIREATENAKQARIIDIPLYLRQLEL
jgi:transposase